MFALIGLGAGAMLAIVGFMTITAIRVVVPTNYTHIVQSARRTTSYGAGLEAGNSYYRWPAWLPLIGVTTTALPVSVFDLQLKDYLGYDIGRVPFALDLMGFFRISNTNMAAARVPSFDVLKQQLTGIVQGAVRTVLATSEIEDILQQRAIFGDKFTQEVQHQLEEWGVLPVKNLELMDIRDAQGSQVISNIMAKKTSLIAAQSRQEVAANNQTASVREIEAKQAVAIREQEALEQIGMRTAEKDQQIGIRQQQASQAIQEAQAATNQKTIAAKTVLDVGNATIAKSVQEVGAEQAKSVSITTAEGTKQKTVLEAEGRMEAQKRNAEGIQAEGLAKAAAEQAMQLAPVQAQITLAHEIGENQGYQHYLLSIRQIEAAQAVGIQQAEALDKADIKVFATSGTPSGGITSVMDLFSAQGGLKLGAMVEAFKETGAQLLNGGAAKH